MVDVIAQLWVFLGFDAVPPQTMSELIPYMLKVVLTLGVLASVFAFFRSLSSGTMFKGRF